MLFINKLFNSIACLLSFTNLQLVIPGRTWILLYLGRTVYKRLWACLALYTYDGPSATGHTSMYRLWTLSYRSHIYVHMMGSQLQVTHQCTYDGLSATGHTSMYI